MQELSEKLSELRKAHNMTQEELANELHVSRQAVSKWETGRSLPSVDMLRGIAKAFGVPVSELLERGDADELAYRNREELHRVRKWNRFLLLGVVAAAVLAIAGLTLGLVFGLRPNPADAGPRFVGLFYDLTNGDPTRDGKLVTLDTLRQAGSPFVLYAKTPNETGREEYRYYVRGIKPGTTIVGSYATFSGTLYYDSSKWGGKTLRLYEIYRDSDGAMRLKYPKQGVPEGKAPNYQRNDGVSENTDSVRSMKIETRGVRSIEGAVLTERDENFAEIKKTDIFEDLARGDKGMLYRLDPRTCYVVFSFEKAGLSDPAEHYTETKCVATGDLELVYWVPVATENGFFVFDNATGYITFDLPKYRTGQK